MADMDSQIAVIMENLNKEIQGIENRSVAGLLAAGFEVERESNLHVPVEYGHLRGSSYTRKAMDDPQAVEVGYSAKYAVYVHENMEMKWQGKPRRSGLGYYWGPHGFSKFLQKAVEKLYSRIVEIVAEYAKVKE